MEQPIKTYTVPMRFSQIFSASIKVLFGEFSKLFPFAVVFCMINLITTLPSIFLERLSGIGEFFTRNASGLEIAYYVLTLFFYPLYFALYAHIMSAYTEGTAVSFFEAIKKACKGYWKLFLINALYQLVIYGLFSYNYWLDPQKASALTSVFIILITIPCSILLSMAFPFSLMRCIENPVSPFKAVTEGFILLFKSGFWQNFGKLFLDGLCLVLPFSILVATLTLILTIMKWIIPLPVILFLGLILFVVYAAILAQTTLFMQLLYNNAKAVTGQTFDFSDHA